MHTCTHAHPTHATHAAHPPHAAPQVQLSLHDADDCGLRVSGPHSELRAHFGAMSAVRAVLGLQPPLPPQPAGVPLQLPLMVRAAPACNPGQRRLQPQAARQRRLQP